MNYGETIDAIVGTDPNARFVPRNTTLQRDTSLGDLAQAEYEDARYWHLLAAINKDRGYFKLDQASAQSKIVAGRLVEVWHVSIYNGLDIETRTRVAGQNRAAAYDELLKLAEAGHAFDASELTEQFRARELDLALSSVNPGGARNLRELSLKYYEDAKYWPLIVWANRAAFLGQPNEDTPPPDGALSIIQFIGWPR
jgi:hypothetical protein